MATRDAVNRRPQVLLNERPAFQLIESVFRMVAGGSVRSRIRCTLAEDPRSVVAASQAVHTTFAASVGHTRSEATKTEYPVPATDHDGPAAQSGSAAKSSPDVNNCSLPCSIFGRYTPSRSRLGV